MPDVDVLILSTSCKDLSCLSKHKSSSVAVLGLQHSPGGSADTFRGGLLSYLDNHKASVIFYENSDHLVDDGDNSEALQHNTTYQVEKNALVGEK